MLPSLIANPLVLDAVSRVFEKPKKTNKSLVVFSVQPWLQLCA
jgi:hypothetical protein